MPTVSFLCKATRHGRSIDACSLPPARPRIVLLTLSCLQCGRCSAETMPEACHGSCSGIHVAQAEDKRHPLT